jgi:high-affinity iron transporter
MFYRILDRWLMAMLLATYTLIGGPAHAADTTETKAKQIWQLLDYVAVDYGGAIANGAVLKASEYTEMSEFANAAERQLRELPGQTGKDALLKQAAELRGAVANKADPVIVARLAHALSSAVQKTYPFPVAPVAMPDLARGAQLFQTQCAACHGPQGRGDGSLAASLNPKPTALTDHLRARERSLFALHQVISNGVQGTAMQGFDSLSDKDRWALAFFVGTLSYAESDKAEGAKLWQANAKASQTVVNLDALTQISEHVLADRLDEPSAKALIAYLRTNPTALDANKPKGTAIAKAKLAESVAALQGGDRAAATKLALSAYLDGFEPVEPALATRNRQLFEKIEAAMVSYRALLANGTPADVQAAQQRLQGYLGEADNVLAPSENDAVAAFVGALTILLREGLEALLVVVAMLAFLKKAERKDVVVYVHAGWVAALAAGGATWFVATYLVDVSGASRELTEGFSSIFAAVVLLGVGMWMHQKSVAGRWQVYLKEKLSTALNKRTAWFLFSLAFVAMYREVFETVLFYTALWTEGNGWPLLAGLGTGMALLALIALVLLRTSARLPIGQFFAASSLLVVVLAVILAGKGIAGLQEAGLLHTSPVAIPRIDLLGIHPSWETLLAQVAVLLTVVVAFRINLRSSRQMTIQQS